MIAGLLGFALHPESHRDRARPLARWEVAKILESAAALLARFPECFWFWRSDVHLTSSADVRLVVQNLRKFGNREAWMAAQQLDQCLSANSKNRPNRAREDRSPESCFAVDIISNATDASPRYSRDFDIFHEIAGEVVPASEADIESLRAARMLDAHRSRCCP